MKEKKENIDRITEKSPSLIFLLTGMLKKGSFGMSLFYLNL